MAFRFRLAQLLRLRDSFEARERLLLEQLQRALLQADGELTAITAERIHAGNARLLRLGDGLKSSEVQSLMAHEQRLDLRAEQVKARLEELRASRDQQLRIYQAARRETQVLENLRERQEERYTQAEKRDEQKVLDDLFLARRRNYD